MRLSQFWTLINDEFGAAYASTVARDHVLSAVGGRTALEAIEAGVSPKQVWQAICEDFDIPLSRRLGKDVQPQRVTPE